MQFDKEHYKQVFEDFILQNRIKESQDFFKIKLFLQKSENGLFVAKIGLILQDK
ncbi:hypothetical protein HYX11_00485 [Candidatus Woesearchaeota archaeon]|nr:hypothetical protein [Candidatus Woesearchaeota archaeon]